MSWKLSTQKTTITEKGLTRQAEYDLIHRTLTKQRDRKMLQSKAKSFESDWEYEDIKRQERKQAKKLREQRKNKRSQWEAVE